MPTQPMQPYVIKQGDYLAKLAQQLGFDADSVWNDDKNADLRQLRPDPNMLWPSDVLYVPDQVGKAPDTIPLDTGAANNFVANAPTMPIALKFLDNECASKPCTIEELPDLKDLSTDSEGILKFDVPVTLDVATVQFEDPPFACHCQIGGLNPAATLSGIFQRLQNLAYFSGDETVETSGDVNTVRGALRAFTSPASNPPAASDSSAGGAGQDDAYAAGNSSDTGTADSSSTGSADDADPSAPSTDSDSDSKDGEASEASPTDNAGLRDDGTMEDETSQLLLKSHGC